jgi:DNA polymerase-3 subunit beta
MNFTIPKKTLLRLLQRASGATATKSTIPALNCLQLEATDGKLTVSGTDLYLSISSSAEADVKTSGTIAIPSKDAVERVKAMPDGAISVSSDANAVVTLKAAGSARKFTLRGIPGDDLPPMPKASDGAAVSIHVDILRDLITSTISAVSSDETRAHLNSALLEWADDTIRMVATDGHRLTIRELSTGDKRANMTMLIPLRALGELRRLCDESGGDASITQSGSSAFFEVAGVTFATKLSEATFPPFQQILPKTHQTEAHVAKMPLLDAVRAVALASGEKTGGIKLRFEGGKVTIRSESPEHGEAVDEVSCETSGPPLLVGVNAKYVVDALTAIGAEQITIRMGGDLDPIAMRPADSGGMTALLMPLRL